MSNEAPGRNLGARAGSAAGQISGSKPPQAGVQLAAVARTAAALGIVAWVLFLTYSLGSEAHKTARLNEIMRGTEMIAELRIIVSAAAFAAIAGLLAFISPRPLIVLRGIAALSLVAAIVAGAVLGAVSGTIGGVLACALLLAWALATGDGLLRLLGADSPALRGVSRLALATGIGLALLSFGVFGLALLGLVGDVGLGALFLAGLPLIGLSLRRQSWLGLSKRPLSPAARDAADNDQPSPEQHLTGQTEALTIAFFEYAVLVAIAVICVVSFGSSLAPQSSFDALHYHFAMPRFILEEGRLMLRPDIIQSYFPLGLEMVYVPGMRIGGEVAATLVHWAFAPLTAMLLWTAGNRLFGRPAGAVAAAIFSLMPLVIVEAPSASSDLAVTFYIAGAAVLLADFAGRKQGDGVRSALTLAALAGGFGGLALAFKIVAGLYIMALAGAFLVVLAWQTRQRITPVYAGVAFAVAGLVAGSPWLIVRWVQTDNPVFPLFNGIFKSDIWPPINERFDLFLYGIGTSGQDFVSIWWEATLHPWRFGQGAPPWFFGLPFLLSLAFIAFWPAFRTDRRTLAWSALAFGAFVAWFFWSQYHRYGLPPAALLAVPAAGALAGAVRQLGGGLASAALVPLVCVWFAAAAANTLAINFPDPYPSDVLLRNETREEYRIRVLADYLPLEYVESVTAGTDDDAFIHGYPFNYFVQNRVWDSILPAQISPVRRVSFLSPTPAALATALLEERVRYLVIDYNLAAQQGVPEWLSTTLMSPNFLESHTRVVFERFNVKVYEVLPP